MKPPETLWLVSGDGYTTMDFGDYEAAEFFALRMSQASNAIFKIKKFDYSERTSSIVRTVYPHEYKIPGKPQPVRPPRPLTPYEKSLVYLNIHEPFTRQDLKAAFRIQAKTKHPDTGGSQSAFLELQSHYEFVLKQKGW